MRTARIVLLGVTLATLTALPALGQKPSLPSAHPGLQAAAAQRQRMINAAMAQRQRAMSSGAVVQRGTPVDTSNWPTAQSIQRFSGHRLPRSRHSGFLPTIQERFPVFGLGFDAHHFQVTRGRRSGFGFGFPIKGGRFFNGGFFGGFGLPFVSSSVAVVPQVIEVPVPFAVPVAVQPEAAETEREAVGAVPGLPQTWKQWLLRVVEPSVRPEPPHIAPLTLLVLKDDTTHVAADYWLEDGRLFYLSSTGREDSFLLRDLDLGMTRRLNSERGVRFVLRDRN